MSTGALGNLRFGPLRFVLDPTQNPSGNAYPFGGTEIGFAERTVVAWTEEELEIAAEEFAGAIVGRSIRAQNVEIRTVLRGRDPNAVAALPGGSQSGGTPTLTFDLSSYLGGVLLTEHKLLCVPEEVADGSTAVADSYEEAIYLDAAVVWMGRTAEMQKSFQRADGIPVAWAANQATAGRGAIGTRLAGITGIA